MPESTFRSARTAILKKSATGDTMTVDSKPVHRPVLDYLSESEVKNIVIDEEFRTNIPPLSLDELQQLEANLVADGCRDPLVVWYPDQPESFKCYADQVGKDKHKECDVGPGDGVWTCKTCDYGVAPYEPTLIDGHNRFEICRRLGIEFEAVLMEFADRDEVMLWQIDNQLGKRNLTAFARTELELKKEPILKKKAEERQAHGKTGPGRTLLPNLAKASPVHTRDEIAKSAGVASETVRKVKKLVEDAPEEVKQQLRKGEKSIDAAFREVTGKPKKKIPPATSNGQSRVNGHVVPDPPDVAKARAEGKIAPGVVPDVDEPGESTSVDDVREEIEEHKAKSETDLSDADWLAKLPLHTQLTGSQLKTFEEDALSFRELESARKTYKHHADRVLKPRRRRGAFMARVRSFLSINEPKKWVKCPSVHDGGCGGVGQIGMVGQCPKCQGRGYRING